MEGAEDTGPETQTVLSKSIEEADWRQFTVIELLKISTDLNIAVESQKKSDLVATLSQYRFENQAAISIIATAYCGEATAFISPIADKWTSQKLAMLIKSISCVEPSLMAVSLALLYFNKEIEVISEVFDYNEVYLQEFSGVPGAEQSCVFRPGIHQEDSAVSL